MSWPHDQLTVSKHGIVKIGAECRWGNDLDHFTSIKVAAVHDLQEKFLEHTIWLVGEFIHVIRAEGNQTRARWGEAAILESYCAMNAKNLLQLADFLDTLPSEKFAMDAYARDEHDEALELAAHECGTVCCAAGWGPAAGLAPLPSDDSWEEYTHRVFGVEAADPAWSWCFSGLWRRADNTPAGAAKRIRHLVEHGLPENWGEQIFGRGYVFA